MDEDEKLIIFKMKLLNMEERIYKILITIKL